MYDHHNSLDHVVRLDWRTVFRADKEQETAERGEVDSVFTVLTLSCSQECLTDAKLHRVAAVYIHTDTNSREFQRLLELFYVFWLFFKSFKSPATSVV